jgi:serine protease inhibitor
MDSHWAVRAIALALPALLLVGCKSGSAGPPPLQPTPPKMPDRPTEATGRPDERLVAADTRFAFKLFAELLREEAGKNVFVSPSSIAFALGMTYNGAVGQTQEAMAKALELEGLTLDEVNQANAALKAILKNPDPQVELSIANSLWARQGIEFKPAFMEANLESYGAQVTTLDFAAPGAARTINDWVSEETRGKIKQIVPEPVDAAAILFLINAVYFKGTWTDPFDKARTLDHPFTLLDGSEKTVPMMSQSGEYPYLETEDFQAISLPYGQKRVSMYVLLPSKASSLKNLCQELTAENWDEWTHKLATREGTIKLPRFRTECDFTLNDALKALGMEVAFDPNQADFGAMCPTPPIVYINQVKHKTFVEVNEEGTEAAAATSIGMAGAAAPSETRPPFEMIVDRPFFCAIRDRATGTVLFMGAIVAPS